MAITTSFDAFNPAVPNTSDPNYLGYSKTIEQPHPNTVLGTALKGIGDLFHEGLKTADFLVEKKVEDNVYNDAKVIQTEYKSEVEDVADLVAGKVPNSVAVTPGSQGRPLDILAAASADKVPDAIEGLPARVGNLVSARANGRYTDTQYKSELSVMAKYYNSNYPGYRKEIAAALAQATGIDHIDNAYIQAKMADINSAITKQNTEHEKVMSFIRQHMDDIPGMNVIASNYLKTGDSQAVYDHVAANSAEKIAYETKNRKALSKDLDLKDAEKNATDTITSIATNSAATMMNAIKIGTGMTPDKTVDLIGKASRNEINVDDTTTRLWASSIMQAKQQAYDDAWKQASTLKGSSGRTLVQEVGLNKAKDMINTSLSQYDDIAKLITDKDYGLAFRMANAVKDIGHKTTNMLLNDKTVGGYSRLLQATHEIGGDQVANALLARKGLAAYKEGLDTLMDHLTMEMMVQPNVDKGGEPKTLTSVLDELDQKQLKGAKTYEAATSAIMGVTDPKVGDKAKAGLILAAFGPGNEDILKRFEKDRIEDGKVVLGRYHVYNKFLSDEFRNEVLRIGEQYPELKKMYLSWAGNTYRNDLIRTSLQDLGDQLKNPAVQVSWNDKTKEMTVLPTTGTHRNVPEAPSNTRLTNYSKYAVQAAQDVQVERLRQTLTRINSATIPLAKLYESVGYDSDKIDTEIFTLMMSGRGLDPTLGNSITGIPRMIMDSISASKLKEQAAKANQQKFESK